MDYKKPQEPPGLTNGIPHNICRNCNKLIKRIGFYGYAESMCKRYLFPTEWWMKCDDFESSVDYGD